MERHGARVHGLQEKPLIVVEAEGEHVGTCDAKESVTGVYG